LRRSAIAAGYEQSNRVGEPCGWQIGVGGLLVPSGRAR